MYIQYWYNNAMQHCPSKLCLNNNHFSRPAKKVVKRDDEEKRKQKSRCVHP